MGKCIKAINGRHVRGGYLLGIEKMGRCKTHFIEVINDMHVGGGIKYLTSKRWVGAERLSMVGMLEGVTCMY